MARKFGKVGMNLHFKTSEHAPGKPVLSVNFQGLKGVFLRDRLEMISAMLFCRRPFVFDIVLNEDQARRVVSEVVGSFDSTLKVISDG